MAYNYHYKPKRHIKKEIRDKLIILSYVLVFVLGFLVSYTVYYDQVEPEPVKIIVTPEILSASSNVVAVSQDQQIGLLGDVEAVITDGTGKVLISTNPFIEPDTQYSATIAVEVAKNYTKTDLSNKNVIFSFNVSGNVMVVGGPSAGASMVSATIAAIEDKEINESIVVTGTITPDGKIGQVGSIFEKAYVSAYNNKTMFLVPKGQSQLVYYEKQVKEEEPVRGFKIYRTKYVPKTLDLVEYAEENWNLSVREVDNISDIVKYMIVD